MVQEPNRRKPGPDVRGNMPCGGDVSCNRTFARIHRLGIGILCVSGLFLGGCHGRGEGGTNGFTSMMNGSNGTQTVQRPPSPPGDIRGTPIGATPVTTSFANSATVGVVDPEASTTTDATSVTLEGTVRETLGTPSSWNMSQPMNLPPPPVTTSASAPSSPPSSAQGGWSAAPVVAASSWDAGDPGRIYRVAYSADDSWVSESGTGSATGIPGWLSDREGTGLPLIAPVSPDGTPLVVAEMSASPVVTHPTVAPPPTVSAARNARAGIRSGTAGGAKPDAESEKAKMDTKTDAAAPTDITVLASAELARADTAVVSEATLEPMVIPDSVQELAGSGGIGVFAETDRIRVAIPRERLFEADGPVWVAEGREFAERVWEKVFAVFADRKMEVIGYVPARGGVKDSADETVSGDENSVDGSADAGKMNAESVAATKVAVAQVAEMVQVAVEVEKHPESQFQVRGREALASDVPRKPDDPPQSDSDTAVQPWIEIVILRDLFSPTAAPGS